MNRIDCSHVRREIEEAVNAEILAAPARDHLRSCAACSSFGKEQQQLKEMVASLGGVEAPADFNFRLQARLAASRSSRFSRRGSFSGNGFGMRSVAFASLVLLLGFVVVLMNMRSPGNESVPVAQAPAADTGAKPAQIRQAEGTTGANSDVVATALNKDVVPALVQEGNRVTNPIRRSNSSVPQFVARTGRVKATDLSASAAPVLRPQTELGSSMFPLGTSYQSLKVSVDDGRGSSRTISLPTVSFGSSRVLARNPAPTMISTRDSW